jgi:hypothetical protein
VDRYLIHGFVGTATTLLLLAFAFPGDVDTESFARVLSVDLVSVPCLMIGRFGCRFRAGTDDVVRW